MKGNVFVMWNVLLFLLFKKIYFELYEIDSRFIEKKNKVKFIIEYKYWWNKNMCFKKMYC